MFIEFFCFYFFVDYESERIVHQIENRAIEISNKCYVDYVRLKNYDFIESLIFE